MPEKRTEKMLLREGDLHIPLLIHREMRSNARISIGKDAVHLRIPLLAMPGSEQVHLRWARDWLRTQFTAKPALGDRFRYREYRQGMEIRTSLKTYRLQLVREQRRSISSKADEDRLVLRLPQNPPGGFTTEQIQRAIAKAVGQDQLEWLSGRVHDWNARFFHEKIESIRIKYVKSKWGSCSSDRHLSFSSRLLLAPPPCIDYVIVHELAHLKELNHSARFWQWVARAMPAYKTWDKQLRHHGQKFDF